MIGIIFFKSFERLNVEIISIIKNIINPGHWKHPIVCDSEMLPFFPESIIKYATHLVINIRDRCGIEVATGY